MTEDFTVSHERGNWLNHTTKLKEACLWAGVEQGRAKEYADVIRGLFETWEPRFEQDGKWRDRLLAYNESCEIVDIHRNWSRFAHEFPGLKKKISQSFKKGPLVQEDENPDRATNRPRNDAFVYGTAGRLIGPQVGIISVDGVPRTGLKCSSGSPVDIDLTHHNHRLVLECKRIQGSNALQARVEEARQQIRKAIKEGEFGIVCIDFSVTIRPPATLLSKKTESQASNYIASQLEEWAREAITDLFADTTISGLWAFARVPVMLEEEYRILSPSGRPYEKPIPYSVAYSIMVSNEYSLGKLVFNKLKQIVSAEKN